MKKNYLFLLFLSFHLFQFDSNAQNSEVIKFGNGKFITKNNIADGKFNVKKIAEAAYEDKYYAAVQFASIPDSRTKDELKNAGILLDKYLSDNAYWATIQKGFDFSVAARYKITSINAIPAFYKIDKNILLQPEKSIGKDNQKIIAVSYFSSIEKSKVEKILTAKGAIIVQSKFNIPSVIFIQPNKATANGIAILPFVKSISLISTKDKILNYNNSGSASISSVQSIAGKNLNGSGVFMGIGDNADITTTHIDFTGRVISRVYSGPAVHGTHTSGTAAGAGLLNPKNKGVAPKSTIVSQLFSDIIANTPTYITDYNMQVTNNSYTSADIGCVGNNQYDILSSFVDNQLQTNTKLVHCFAAGNDGGITCNGYPQAFATIKSGWQTAKNVISVGSIDASTYIISPTSSRGPVADGRLKPEIVANGINTTSAITNNTYFPSSGTSMASPVVAGAIALLQQRHKQLNANVYPNSALVKVLLCNTAQDEGNPGPDYTYGFGLINVRRAVEAMENNQYIQGTIINAQTQQNNLIVPAGVRRLKVMLYWNDVEALPNPASALVNDLDLTVTDPLAIDVLPLILNATPAGVTNNALPGADHINNIEQVVIDNPIAGNYSLNVNGFNIPNGSQDYTITYQMDMNGVTVEYPFGGETLVPTQSEIIRFNGNGNENDSYTLEFSDDNGMNWTTIDNNVPAANQSYTWIVPSITTNEGLIRITRNNTAYQDVSDFPFTILGQPVVTASNVCDGYVQLSWPAITDATSYDVMQLKGDSMSVITNTAGTSFLVTGLNSSTKYWFAVRANNGAVAGRRSLAVSSTPSAGACTLVSFDNDLKAVQITEPVTGRALTSTAAQAVVPIKVSIKNLDNAVSNIAFDISYQINGGAAFTENIAPVIAAGGTYVHTFPQHPIGGNTYDIKVWVDKAGDLQQSNDTVATLVRVLTNPVVVLPSINGFESTTNSTYTTGTLGLEGDDRLDFAAASTRGRARTFVNTGFARTGDRAITLDQTPASVTDQADSLIQTLNLSNYDLNNNQLRLDFYYRDQGQETYDGNKIWIRGSDTEDWVEAYNQGADMDHLGEYNKAIINVNNLLLNAVPPQNVSSSFQIKFGQQGTTSANNVTPITKNDDGYTFDDVTVSEAFNDVAIENIIAPTQSGCQLGNNEPISVAIKNYGAGTANNVNVSYSVNGAPAVTEVIPSINSGSTINHVFAAPFDFSAFIDYNIDFWIDLPTDTYKDNDSLLNYSFHNSPLISSYPYLEGFEANNGNWYTNGTNSSWQWGTPTKTFINKAANGNNSWTTNLTGDHNNDELSYLYSPCFDLSGLTTPVLSFSHILDIEFGFDYNWVEYSTDGGLAWQKLGPGPGTTNWYDDVPNKRWKQSNTKWHVASIDVPTNGSSVRFRIAMSADAGVTQEGIGIDDIHVFDKAGIYTGADVSAAPQAVSGNNWFHFTSGGKRIVSLNPNNNNLGATSADVYFNVGPVRSSSNNQYYLDRNIVVSTTTPPVTDVTVRFYFTDAEALALMNANGCGLCTTISDPYVSGVTKYSGTIVDENGSLADNLNGVKEFILPANVQIIPFEDGYYAEFTVNSFSEFWINNGGLNADEPLPLKLLSFDAIKQNSKTLLKWSTDNETNIDQFIVERSSNAVDYISIGNVNSTNQPGINNYSFTDEQPLQGINYYRLKIIDKDNVFAYSPTRNVKFGPANDISIYPNPVTNALLNVTTSANCKKAILFDATGKQVRAFTLQGMYNSLDLHNIAKGIYQLKVFTDNAVYIRKVIVQ